MCTKQWYLSDRVLATAIKKLSVSCGKKDADLRKVEDTSEGVSVDTPTDSVPVVFTADSAVLS